MSYTTPPQKKSQKGHSIHIQHRRKTKLIHINIHGEIYTEDERKRGRDIIIDKYTDRK